MALRLTRAVGTAIVFYVRDRTARLTFDGVDDSRGVFGLSDNHTHKRIRSAAGRSLMFQIRGELFEVFLDEVHAGRASFQVIASPRVQVFKEELTTGAERRAVE